MMTYAVFKWNNVFEYKKAINKNQLGRKFLNKNQITSAVVKGDSDQGIGCVPLKSEFLF